MSIALEMLDLVLSCVQELGIIFGVGGEVVLLVLYLFAIRDFTIDTKEMSVTNAVRRVVNAGLACIVLSGIGITALHCLSGEVGIVLQPAYIAKWLLIVAVVATALYHRHIAFSKGMLEGLVGALWFGMLLIHLIAPAVSGGLVAVSLAAWIVCFVSVWAGIGSYGEAL